MSEQGKGIAAPISAAADGYVSRALSRIVTIKPGEVAAVGWSWLYIFAVLSAYYIIRPIRDQMGVAGGVGNLQWLFMGTLAVMLLVNIPFGFLVKMLPRTRFIPITYRCFAAVILLFALALHGPMPRKPYGSAAPSSFGFRSSICSSSRSSGH